jgi:hypothetical protein
MQKEMGRGKDSLVVPQNMRKSRHRQVQEVNRCIS